ncbi:MAG: UDP-N-acetylmuramoyl-L-alanine--D-glutamate ligase [Phycisphaeraceae bacterium]|nr:UDP-N-acetylmuramoyl-L-alanine--D-glutamate ligase [Phycisphaeraceae bacterium]
MDDLSSLRVTVMGLGRFGGGLGAARWLLDRGATVTVTDLQPESALTATLDELRARDRSGRLRIAVGGHDLRDFEQCEMVVVNPAVPKPWENAYLQSAMRCGARVTTEIGLLVEHLPTDRIIGVTGSAGKSTTCAMLHRLLEAVHGKAWLGGNIGGSLLGELDRIHCEHWVVLELSSFMLHWLGPASGQPWSPRVAVLTNLSPNHLDWHGSFDHYAESKRAIRASQRPGDRFITRFAREASSHEAARRLGASPWWTPDDGCGFADQLAPHLRLRIPGAHAVANALLALDAAHAALTLAGREPDGSAKSMMLGAIESFEGLPHRLSLILERDGVRWFDDSKSTTPESLFTAVAAFDDPARIHLIAGGYDKGADLAPVRALAPRLAGLYAIGTTGPALCGLAGSIRCETIERAAAEAASRARPGDVVLLSPGCASWDQFPNYEVRGQRFAEVVRALAPLPSR